MATGRRPGSLGLHSYGGDRVQLRGPLALQVLDDETRPLEPLEALKARARRAIPVIGARIADWNNNINPPKYWRGTLAQGKDPDARNAIYNGMYKTMTRGRGRTWFAAATKVTGSGGIRSLDGNLPRAMAWLTALTADDMVFIVSGNEFLFPYNLHNYFVLQDAKNEIPGLEGLRHRALDTGLVVFEQTLVQKFIDSFRWSSSERTAACARISAGFPGVVVRSLDSGTLATALRCRV